MVEFVLLLKRLIVLSVLSNVSAVTDQLCSNQTTCGRCIAASPHCAWCQFPGFGGPAFNQYRCDTNESLVSSGCPVSDIISPDHQLTIVKVGTLLYISVFFSTAYPPVAHARGLERWYLVLGGVAVVRGFGPQSDLELSFAEILIYQ
jgi:hypothetical protein